MELGRSKPSDELTPEQRAAAATVEHPPPAEPPAPAAADEVPPPQLGGATVSDTAALEQAQKAKNDPGYVSARPLLTTGAYGHDVAVLAMLLDAAGYPNPVNAGLEAPMLTDELMRMVRAFQDDKGIDPAGPQHGVDPNGPAAGPLVRKDHEGIVDATTWAELFDAADDDVVEVIIAAQLGMTGKETSALRYSAGAFA